MSAGSGEFGPTLRHTDAGVLGPNFATLFYLVGLANFPLVPGN